MHDCSFLMRYGKLLIFNICKISSGVMWNPRSSFDTLSLKFEQLTTKTLKQNSNRHKCIELRVKSIKQNSRILDAIYPTGHEQKSSQPMCARMPHSTAQFVLKIAKLSHVITLSTIIGTAPTLEMAQACSLRYRNRDLPCIFTFQHTRPKKNGFCPERDSNSLIPDY